MNKNFFFYKMYYLIHLISILKILYQDLNVQINKIKDIIESTKS